MVRENFTRTIIEILKVHTYLLEKMLIRQLLYLRIYAHNC